MISALCSCLLLFQIVPNNRPKPQVVTFPDRVIKSRLNPSSSANSQDYQKLLRTQKQTLSFQTHINPKSNTEIQIPSTGKFKLVVKAGSHLHVIDNNATDGSASITMPRGTFKTAIQIPGAQSSHSKMEIHDPLFHLQDTLGSSQSHQWMNIGLRPVPVPANWHSQDGSDYVLHFENQNINAFHMVMQASTQTAPYPPGIKKIGPEGGVVELPGVGKLELPPGALKKETTVSLHQEKEAKVGFDYAPMIGFFKNKTIGSSVLRVEPFGLKTSKPFKIYLDISNADLVRKKIVPLAQRFAVSEDNEHWLYIDFFNDLSYYDDQIGISKEPAAYNALLYFTKTIPYTKTSQNQSSTSTSNPSNP